MKFIDIEIDVQDIGSGIEALLKELKPEWDHKDVISKEFTDGYSNQMICYYLGTDEEMKDGLIVRTHLYDAESLNRNNEVGYTRDMKWWLHIQ